MKPWLCAIWAVILASLLAALPSGAANPLVSSNDTDNILRYDGQTGAFVTVFAAGGGVDRPDGLVVGPDGHLYVSSLSTDQVLRYDGETGAFLGIFASGGGLSRPFGMVFGPNDHLYVSSGATGQVLRYDGQTGTFLGVFATGGGLSQPGHLIFTELPPPPPTLAERVDVLETQVAALAAQLEGVASQNAMLQEQLMDLQDALALHTHTYRTGEGVGHNTVETRTGVAEFEE
jgi:hypothetical protein